MAKGPRIATDGGQRLQVDNPFATISSEGLPQTTEPAAAQKATAATEQAPKRRGELLLRKLKAGKGGKTVTEISGWPGNEDVAAMLLDLKRRFGTGGTSKARVIELQGEWRDALRPYLASLGYKVKG